MKLSDIKVVGGPLVLSSDADVDAVEQELKVVFPNGYRDFVTTLGEGTLGGYVRVYPPRRILAGLNNVQEWRERINEFWFWDGRDLLTKNRAMQCVIIGDTVNGDELIVHPSQPQRIYILPRDYEHIPFVDAGLFATLDWLCASGELTDAFDGRDFEPFDSAGQA